MYSFVSLNKSDQDFFSEVAGYLIDLHLDNQKGADEKIKAADGLMKFADANTGREFGNGVKLGKTSNLQLYAYGGFINAYIEKKDCASAQKAFEEFKSIYLTDYTIIDAKSNLVFDSGADGERYLTAKKADAIDLVSGINFGGGCFDSVEYADWMNRVAEMNFFHNIMELRRYSFGYWEKNPKNGVKNAEKMIALIHSFDGHVFPGGRVFSPDSTLLIYAYDAMINAYEHKNKCKRVGEFFPKLKAVSSGNYLVVVPETGDVYDPEKDADVYAEMRRQDLAAIHDYIVPRFYCFNKDEYAALFR
jgi:hypothetical protein